jgi:hypothetical protein
MKNEDGHQEKVQKKKKEQLHTDCRHWKSTLSFIDDEIVFIKHMLGSYIFEPNTPNLFERLQDYQGRLRKVEYKRTQVFTDITSHENSLGGILECETDACFHGFYDKHDVLKASVVGFNEEFRHLKSEIFNYAGGILKKRKE